MDINTPGPQTFLQLSDTPDSYSGAATEVATVNAGETALIFSAGGAGSPVLSYDLSASLDGSTKSFTVPANTRFVLVVGSSTPFVFRPTVDYTGTGTTTLTFAAGVDATTMLAAGQTLILLYS